MAMKGALDEDGVPIKTGPGKNLSDIYDRSSLDS